MAEIVYLLCGFSSMVCALLLFRSYQRHPTRLLLWTAISFCFFAMNNILLVADLVFLPQIDLLMARTICLVVAVIVMMYGLIWEIA